MTSIQVLRIQTSKASAVLLEELLTPFSLSLSVQTQKDRGVVEIYGESSPEALGWDLAHYLAEWRDLLPDPVTIERTEIPQEDWAETWKQYFHPLRVTERIAICPTWEDLPADMEAAECVIRIDPGMSFGTGRHGTTLACLEFIDQLAERAEGVSLLDVGCGSGILSIAAAKLGFRPVRAFDFDPDAVTIAKENLTLNEVSWVDCSVQDLARYQPLEPSTVVVANLESRILLPNRGALVDCVETGPDSYLILAGILTTEYDDVVRTFLSMGFDELDSRTIKEWRSALLRRH